MDKWLAPSKNELDGPTGSASCIPSIHPQGGPDAWSLCASEFETGYQRRVPKRHFLLRYPYHDRVHGPDHDHGRLC